MAHTADQALCSSVCRRGDFGDRPLSRLFYYRQRVGRIGWVEPHHCVRTGLNRADHIDRVPYLLKLAGGDKNPLDDWVVPMVFGTLAGGLVSGWLNGRLKVETNKGPNISNRRRWVWAFVGGVIMGYGARMARGCTSGQALSGGATLSVGSWAFMFAVFGGAYAVAYFVRRLWN
ncbi:MAG: YeeE/YedE thiosulfate transporter family protein [Caldilineaceae bacterium]